MAFLFIVYVPFEVEGEEPGLSGSHPSVNKADDATDVCVEKQPDAEENNADGDSKQTEEGEKVEPEQQVDDGGGTKGQIVENNEDESGPSAMEIEAEEASDTPDGTGTGGSSKEPGTSDTAKVSGGTSTGEPGDGNTSTGEPGDGSDPRQTDGDEDTTVIQEQDSMKQDKVDENQADKPKVKFRVEPLKTPEVAESESKKLSLDGEVTECHTEPSEAKDGSADLSPVQDGSLVPLIQKEPLYQAVKNLLNDMNIDNIDETKVGGDRYLKMSFVQENSLHCENILNRLKAIGVGQASGSSISVFPSSLHESSFTTEPLSDEDTSEAVDSVQSEEVNQEESQFKKSIKSRMVVAQVIDSVRNNATFTFDYLLLLILASLISCLGLVENSSVVLVASMLISPLMGPILAITFGQGIKASDLRNVGLKSEAIGLLLCVVVGFVFGLISGGIGLEGAIWGSTDEWPTTEMKSRGMLRSLWVGMLIALPSGAGVAISVLGGNAGSLVGVAISASLLPPACNAGMLWAYALLAAISPPAVQEALTSTVESITTTMATLPNTTFSTQNSSDVNITVVPSTHPGYIPPNCLPLINNGYQPVYSCNISHDALVLGLVSLTLTLLNITCILIMGYIILRIKEVAPHTAGTVMDDFWQKDVKVARTYYQTTKGEHSTNLGKQFLAEWKRLKSEDKGQARGDQVEDGEDDQSLSDPVETIEMVNYIKDVEASQSMQHVIAKLSPTEPVSNGLIGVYSQAAHSISKSIRRHPAMYLAEPKIGNSKVRKAYHTIHSVSEPTSARPGIQDIRARFQKASSMYIPSPLLPKINEDSVKEVNEDYTLPHVSRSDVGILRPFKNKLYMRRKRNKFEVSKVEEEEELV